MPENHPRRPAGEPDPQDEVAALLRRIGRGLWRRARMAALADGLWTALLVGWAFALAGRLAAIPAVVTVAAVPLSMAAGAAVFIRRWRVHGRRAPSAGAYLDRRYGLRERLATAEALLSEVGGANEACEAGVQSHGAGADAVARPWAGAFWRDGGAAAAWVRERDAEWRAGGAAGRPLFDGGAARGWGRSFWTATAWVTTLLLFPEPVAPGASSLASRSRSGGADGAAALDGEDDSASSAFPAFPPPGGHGAAESPERPEGPEGPEGNGIFSEPSSPPPAPATMAGEGGGAAREGGGDYDNNKAEPVPASFDAAVAALARTAAPPDGDEPLSPGLSPRAPAYNPDGDGRGAGDDGARGERMARHDYASTELIAADGEAGGAPELSAGARVEAYLPAGYDGHGGGGRIPARWREGVARYMAVLAVGGVDAGMDER